MHVLHIYKDYAPVVGGIENSVRALAEAHVRRGGAATVLVTDPGPRTTETWLNGVRVIKAGRLATVASTPLSLDLPRQLARLRPDLTHLHAPYPVGELAQGWAGRGRPYVLSYQADVTRLVQRLVLGLYAPYLRRCLRRAARVLITTERFARTSPVLRGSGARLARVPLGVDPERFQPAPPDPGRPPTLLFVGQLRHYKGLDVLLRAGPDLPPATRLVIAGHGPQRTAWEALAQQTGWGERVRWLGNVLDADLPRLYQAADVFVLPSVSRAESFGLVLVEAMASGLPCVTTEIGTGTSEVVQDGVTGLVTPPRDPAALAAALGRLLTEPAMRAALGAAGRARALAEFTVERMVARTEAVYAEVLAGR